MTTLRAIRLATWVVVALLIAATGWVVIDAQRGGGPTIGGSFHLVDMDGRPVTEAMFAGRPHAVFFGYTHCPDVCPTTLAELTVLMERLGPPADRLAIAFITVDPDRDTPEVLKNYLTAFTDRVVGLSGTQAEIDDVVGKYRVYAKKVPGSAPDDYTMDHTASVFLFDAAGDFRGTIAYTEPEDDAFAKLKRLVDG